MKFILEVHRLTIHSEMRLSVQLHDHRHSIKNMCRLIVLSLLQMLLLAVGWMSAIPVSEVFFQFNPTQINMHKEHINLLTLTHITFVGDLCFYSA